MIVPLSVSHNGHRRPAARRATRLLCRDGNWFTVLSHPKSATSVSLEASASDTAGNSATETIVDSFLLE